MVNMGRRMTPHPRAMVALKSRAQPISPPNCMIADSRTAVDHDYGAVET
jgi:hypothetical protein